MASPGPSSGHHGTTTTDGHHRHPSRLTTARSGDHHPSSLAPAPSFTGDPQADEGS